MLRAVVSKTQQKTIYFNNDVIQLVITKSIWMSVLTMVMVASYIEAASLLGSPLAIFTHWNLIQNALKNSQWLSEITD